MQYTRKNIRSRPGLSQEEALASLQDSPMFRPGTRIASLKLQGDRWVAKIEVPKFAGEFPPSGGDDPSGGGEESSGGGEEKPEPESDDGGSDSPSPDGPPSPGGEGKPGEGGPKASTDDQILHVLTEILHALKGGPATDALGGPDDMGPGAGGPPAPAPHGGPAGAGGPPPGGPPGGHFPGSPGAKLKPGEAPNRPGVTPVGSPAFASTRQAMGELVPGHVPNPAQHTPGGACPTCAGPVGPDGSCPTCMGGGVASGGTAPAPMSTLSPLAHHVASAARMKSSFPVSGPVGASIKEAKALLEPIAAQYGRKIVQAKYEGGRPRFLLTVR